VEHQRGTHSAGDELKLAEGFRGQVIRPRDSGYDEARAVYNGSIDRRPSLIVRPMGAADVIDAVNLAREHGLPLAVRGGGHSVAGNGTVDDGVLVDLSTLKGVRVDPKARTARAGGGVLVGELDRETQLFGLVTPSGRVTTTGIGGFTLGGGYGWTSAKHGLACDNLISADVVTADGKLVRASEDENPDLFWGLRGGSSNFGVVTSFEFKLYPLGPIVLAGMLLHSLDHAGEIIRGYRDYVNNAPDELGTGMAILQAPPAPFVPEHARGKPALGIIAIYVGDPAQGERVIAPLRALAKPVADLLQPIPYTAFQALVDPFSPTGWHNYHRGIHLSGLPDAAIDTYVKLSAEITAVSPITQVIMFRHGGAVSRVPDGATAAGHRDAVYMAHPIACWQDAVQTDMHVRWVRRFSDAMSKFSTGGVYLNFEPDEGEQKVRAGYGPEKYARLVALKDKWDPENLFRINQNIRPSRQRKTLRDSTRGLDLAAG
jgi:FAD/FMN-containing dehydrogenase